METATTTSTRSKRLLEKNLELLLGEDNITECTGGKVRVHLDPTSACVQDSSNLCLPMELTASIEGPDDSPYRGGCFQLNLQVPSDFPFQPPKVQFETTIFHPNVGPWSGLVYLDMLTEGQWSPAWNIKTVLLAVFSILEDPVVEDDYDETSVINLEAAEVFQRSPQEFWDIARQTTLMFACTRGEGLEAETEQRNAKVSSLVEMGFDADVVRLVLESNNWDLDSAATELLVVQEEEGALGKTAAEDGGGASAGSNVVAWSKDECMYESIDESGASHEVFGEDYWPGLLENKKDDKKGDFVKEAAMEQLLPSDKKGEEEVECAREAASEQLPSSENSYISGAVDESCEDEHKFETDNTAPDSGVSAPASQSVDNESSDGVSSSYDLVEEELVALFSDIDGSEWIEVDEILD